MIREEAKSYIGELKMYANSQGWDEEYQIACDTAMNELEQEPCEDTISRKSIKQKLQEHHDFFVNAYGGFSNLPQNDKSRVDEITNCIAMVVNEPPVIPQEPITWIVGKNNAQIAVKNMPIDKLQKICAIIGDEQESVLDKLRAEILEEKECAYADFERYKVEYLGQDWEDALDSLPQDDFRYGMERCIDIIDKYKKESEKE